VAKQQPERRFTLLYDKVHRQDILQEAWKRVKSNKGAAGVDQVDIDAIRDYGEERFLSEVQEELRSRRYRTALVRRVPIPKPGQPGKTQEQSRLTALTDGFAFLGFEFRKAPGRRLYRWPQEKACRNIRQRVREAVRSFPSNGQVGVVIQKLNPILIGWCTYFRVGNSNRTFHKVDLGRSERIAVMASAQAPMPLANCQETMGISLPS